MVFPRILFKDILLMFKNNIFLGLDYRDDSLIITLYHFVIEIDIKKNQMNRIIISHKKLLSKRLKFT